MKLKKINDKFGAGFLYEVKHGELAEDNCRGLTRNPSITLEGNIKFWALDNGKKFKSIANVFKLNITTIYRENQGLLNIMSKLDAPSHRSLECSECEKNIIVASV